MKTTKRFDEAFTKLYNAFNDGILNAGFCDACAVGTLCGNGEWHMGNSLPNITREYSGGAPHHKSYSAEELFNIEVIFLKAHKKWGEENNIRITPYSDDTALMESKEAQFHGLIAVINYLAELDGIESIETSYNKLKDVLNKELQKV